MPTDLSPTSFAILSLLGVRPWSAYELTRQLGRSLEWFWPKAESLVYAECRRLAAAGHATVQAETRGRRRRAVYTITDTGRAALAERLDHDPVPRPRLEFEAMLHVAFADHGSREQLLRALHAIRSDAQEQRARAEAQVDEYARTGGPFPERLPVVALTGKFFLEYAELLARWAEWAEAAVLAWPSMHDAEVPDGAFEAGRWPGDDGDGGADRTSRALPDRSSDR